MSKNIGRIAVMAIVLVVSCLAVAFAQTETPKMAPLRPEVTRDLPPGRGFVPPLMDLSHLTGRQVPATAKLTALPARWDWREQSVVTPVKNQGSCGSCYSFASLANIEAKLLIDGEPTFDFSENNAKECEWYGSSCGGGTYQKMASWLSKTGLVLEACDPYVAADVACNSGCTYIKTLLDWRIICEDSVPSTAVLQQYIYDEGPVYTVLYAGDGFEPAWEAEYNSYDGSYCMYYTGDSTPNHAVLIVGWDDDMAHAGGTGAWIVKNSWGTGWGGNCGYGAESGYFYLAYGSASIGKYSSFMDQWQDYDSDGEVLSWDEGGASSTWGYDDLEGWGLCKFVMPGTAYLTNVEVWTNDVTTDIDVYVYDDFNGVSLSNLLESKLNVSFAEAGYHSIALDTPPEITVGEDIYVAVQFVNATYTYPVCCDQNGPNETATTYLSHFGLPGSWVDMGVSYSDDIAIRVRTSVDLPVSVADDLEALPSGFSLSHNYPNPFNPTTTISYSLETRTQVEIAIYNLLGRKISTLVEGEMPAGEHSVVWDGTDLSGQQVASGIYLYQIRAGEFTDSKKMVLLK